MSNIICRQVSEAQSLLAEGKSKEALRLLNQILQVEPEFKRIWELKGAALYASKEYHLATHALEVATSLAPLSPQGQMMLADCYFRQELYETADCMLAFLTENVAELPASLLPKLAALLGVRGYYAQALRVCRRGVELKPDSDQAMFGLAHYLGKAGYPLEVLLPPLRKAFELAPNILQYRITLAKTLHRSGDPEGAYKLLAKLEFEQIAAMNCRCCVRRLMEVFTFAQDYRRCDWCRGRLQVLNQDIC